MNQRIVNGVLVRQFFQGGRVIDLRTSRTYHWCRQCGHLIKPGEQYYSAVWGGSGLGGLKFPTRLHIDCIDEFLKEDKK